MHHHHMLKIILFSLSLINLPACLQFNQCLSNNGVIIGQAALDLDLRESTIRTQETPVGNLVTDALMIKAQAICQNSNAVNCPDIVLINSGSLRNQSTCGEKDSIKYGNIYEQDIKELLPFENNIVIVNLTGEDIKLALERSVSKLEQGGLSSGHFLQVSGMSFNVSCSEDAQRITNEGLNSQILILGNRVSNIQIIAPDGSLQELDLDKDYEVLTSDYVARGGDGFLSFLIRDQNNKVTFSDDGEALPKMIFEQDRLKDGDGIQITAQNSLIDFTESEYRQKRSIGRPSEGRININANCFVQSFE